MRIDILSLFPDYFRGPFDESMIARARRQGLVDLQLIDLRHYGTGSYKQVDDRAYGGGPGMVLMAGSVAQALREAKGRVEGRSQRTVFLSPQGKPLDASKCRELALVDHLILLCGHYEGVDQRVLDKEVDEEISIGDYVLTNGCLPAIVLVDAVARFIPGVIGHSDAASEDSFERELLDCPHYTRPEVFEGIEVPKVLLEGNHAAIDQWRHERALAKTRLRRPDLFLRYLVRNQQELAVPIEERVQTGWCWQGMTLLVEDLRRSRRFYRDVLGWKPTQESDTMIAFVVGKLKVTMAVGKRPEGRQAAVVLDIMVEDPKTLGLIARKVHSQALGGVEGAERVEKVWFIDPDGYHWVLTGSEDSRKNS